jgi:TRAP-type mannitol/chloroaromatic compound transport system permease large subunit
MSPNQFRVVAMTGLVLVVLGALRLGLTSEQIGGALGLVGLLAAEVGLRTPAPEKP